jgi:tripartite-type tricarboxylate transporter receptor subunit TctC
MIFVSYRDAAQPQADLGEGRIQALVTSLTASSSPVQTGKARFLAVLNPTRAATLPDVKTARELGYPELEVSAASGFFSGNAMPETIRARVAADVAAICQDPEVRSKLEANGHNVLKGTRDDLVARIANQKTWVKEISKYVDIRDAQ